MSEFRPDPDVPVDLLVMGAGAVGCYIGGCLAAQGVRVMFVGRARVLDGLSRHGLRLSDLDGQQLRLSPSAFQISELVPEGVAPTLVLLTVKGGSTMDAAGQLGAMLPPMTNVISFQNGIGNADLASRAAPTLRVLRGMVPFNIAEVAPGYYHRGTAGRLAVQRSRALRPWLGVFRRGGIPLVQHEDMSAVLWGKLLLNLNNPVNALSGLPLRDELLDAGYRRVLAGLMDEALAALDEALIDPVQLAALPPHRLPSVLRLPTPLYKLLAKRMLRIDPQARSSMADDLAMGRRTEVDALCGEVVRLAERHGLSAPMNARIQALMHEARPGQRGLDSRRLLEMLQAPAHAERAARAD